VLPTGQIRTYTGALIQQIKVSLLALALVLFGSAAGQAQTTPLAFTSSGNLPSGQVQVGYSATITATGGEGLRFFNIIQGGLPSGLTLGLVSGSIVGTPSTVGTFVFRVRVQDSGGNSVNQEFTLVINSNVLTVVGSPQNATVGQNYSQSLATGGTPPYTLSLQGGNLPRGLILGSGVLSGTPTQAGNFTFTVRVNDASNPSASATGQVSITVAASSLTISTSSLPSAQINQLYNTSITATNGTSPYSFVLQSGSLPPGMQLSSGGQISGTPTQVGTFTGTFRVTDATSATATATLSISVVAGSLSISTTLPNAALNQTYSANVTASGGTSPYSYSIVSGALPPGLIFNSFGSISGTPTQTGSYSVSFRVTDSQNATAQATLTINVLASTLNITTASLPAGQVGSGYFNSITASGGVGTLSFGVVSGSGALPPGVSLATNGSLVGTPTTPGTYTFTIRVTDGTGASAEREFSITINSNVLAITTTSLPGGQVGITYNATLTASGGGGSVYLFNISSGTLPPGLNLSDSGQISGTPTVAGTYTITFRVTDGFNTANRQLSITITVPTLSITTTTLPNAVLNQSYSASVTAAGGSGSYTFSQQGGTLPPGITLASSGVLSGTPTAAGSYSFTVRAQDSSLASVQSTLTINVNNVSGFAITTTSLPNGQVNVTYSTGLTVSGGTPPYSFSLLSGSLPNGLVLNSNGVISGTPTANGTSTFTVRVTDSGTNSTQSSFTLTIAANVLSIVNSGLLNAQSGSSYSATISATGGVQPYTFNISSGALPAGLTLSSNGAITGTPTATGNFSFVVRVVDAAGGQAIQQFSLAVTAPSLSITNTSLPIGQVNTAYNTALTAIGGSGIYNFSIFSGQLPAGMTFSSTGILGGVPTVVGIFNLTFRVSDSTGAFTQTILNLTISSSLLSFTTTSLPVAILNQPYNATLQASGGTAPYTYALVGGSLPFGLTLSSGGILSGSPQQTGTYSLTFRVSDAASGSAQSTLSLTVNAVGLSITNTSLPSATLGVAYAVTLNGTGGTQPYTFSLVSGPLPAGFSLNPNTGVLSGTSIVPGNFPLSFRLTDATGATTQSSFTLVISSAAITITPSTIPSGAINQSYSATFSASGGTAPYTYSIVLGNLPIGLNFSTQGIISGTPTQSGTFTFTLRVADATGSASQVEYTFNITLTAPTISTTSLPDGNVSAPYSASVVASSASGLALTYSVASGSLPPGVSLGTNGVFSGTPATAGLYNFTVQVSDTQGGTAQRQLSINITTGGGPLTISSFAPPSGRVYYNYNFRLTGSGGFQPYTWSLASGSPPSGLRLDAASGTLSGNPLAYGFYTFSVRVTDSRGTVFDSPTYTIAIIEATRLSNGRVGQAYSAQFSSGGRPPLTISLDSNAIGSLPPGVTMNSAGFFSGTPSASGEFTFGVSVRDADGVTVQNAVTLPVLPASAEFSQILNLPGATAGVNYRQAIRPSGDIVPSSTVLAAGSLPPGITLDSSSAVLNGTPSTPGDYFFTLNFGSGLASSGNAAFRISVAPAGAPALAAVTNAASYASNGVAPGQLLTLFGSGLGPASLQQFTVTNNLLPKELAGTRVLFDGVPAALIYTSAGQVSAIAPFGLLGRVNTNVTVEFNRTVSAPLLIPVVAAQPAIFTLDGSGTGQGAILNQDGTVNGPSNPAAKGSIVVLYGTGGGRMTPSGVDGRVAAAVSSLFQPTLVQIGGQSAELIYAGNAPGIVEGVIQVNARVPQSAGSGSQAVRFSVGGIQSPAGVVLWVQ
jgi:uncharacterized protein (TIGR03437 family)